MTKDASKTAPGASGSNVDEEISPVDDDTPSPAAAPAPSPAAPPATGTASGLEDPLLGRANGQVQKKAWLPACCYHPLSEQATISFLTKAADTSVMGLLTLIAFCATFLLAWGKPGTACIPKPKDTSEVVEPSWVQVLVGSLPFSVFPLTLYVSGMVQAAKKDGHALGPVATLCLLEFIAAIALGGVMTVCMTGSPWWLIAPILMIVLMVLTWGLTFKYPNWLRSFIWLTIFRQHKAAVSTNGAGNNNEEVNVVVNNQ